MPATHEPDCQCSTCALEDELGYDADFGDPKQYCRHGTWIGSWWGPDILCGKCESGEEDALDPEPEPEPRYRITVTNTGLRESWSIPNLSKDSAESFLDIAAQNDAAERGIFVTMTEEEG
jgi:hypothetical protein